MNLPNHIGFIVDGNRRWAKAHGMATIEGHRRGYKVLKDVLLETVHRGVPYVSAYIFSTENWKRSRAEVKYLIDLFVNGLVDDIPIFLRENVRLRVVGSRANLTKRVIRAIEKAEAATAHLTRGELLLCFNYGGKLEVVEAVQQLILEGFDASEVTDERIAERIYAPEVPACDVIVRTSGEKRLSNFMLWRSAYSELIFVDKNWPDMTTDDVTIILDEYDGRERRHGG